MNNAVADKKINAVLERKNSINKLKWLQITNKVVADPKEEDLLQLEWEKLLLRRYIHRAFICLKEPG